MLLCKDTCKGETNSIFEKNFRIKDLINNVGVVKSAKLSAAEPKASAHDVVSVLTTERA